MHTTEKLFYTLSLSVKAYNYVTLLYFQTHSPDLLVENKIDNAHLKVIIQSNFKIILKEIFISKLLRTLQSLIFKYAKTFIKYSKTGLS